MPEKTTTERLKEQIGNTKTERCPKCGRTVRWTFCKGTTGVIFTSSEFYWQCEGGHRVYVYR